MAVKEILQDILKSALNKTINSGEISIQKIPSFAVEKPREEKFGDFYTNLAMVVAPQASKKPRDVANLIINNLNGYSKIISKVEIAGPGFINFFMTQDFWLEALREVIKKGNEYGSLTIGANEKIQVEFVSANPTGPLHVGHGRGAVIGDVLANILKKAGYDVLKEYYINDVGLQMETLGRSALIRYRQLLGEEIEFPQNGYKGDYINDIAKDIILKKGKHFLELPEKESIPFFIEFTANVILEGIKKDLEDFGVRFDHWYSEKTLHERGMVDKVVGWLRDKDFIYEKDDALWLKASAFGDEKDRVVRRGTGYYTYLASDIAYHKEKYERGFKKVINIWGADHHGYVPMMRSSDSHLDFDLDLAKKQSSENPVYYVQYAHARIRSIFRQEEENKLQDLSLETCNLKLLKLTEELSIIKKILAFPELIENIALSLEPHLITHYLLDLCGEFHSYYKKHRFISDDKDLTAARLMLIKALGVVIKNSLDILGVAAPEEM